MIQFYGLKSCDTCKKALKALDAAGKQVDVIDVRSDGVPEAKLATWLAEHGTDVLVNKRSTTWRGLDDAERAEADEAEGAVALLLAHPTLMKRPVTVADGVVRVGWAKDTAAALL